MIVDQLIAELGYSLKGEAELKKFQAGLNNLEKQALAVGAAIGKAAAIAGAAVAGGFGLLGKSVIDTAAQFEKFEATLTTIEGSADKAKASLDWISKFARQTPYEVAELTSSFIKLKSYGIEPMDGTMTVLGDTASAMGKSLNDAVEAFADATSGEFERLKEFGIRSKVAKDKVSFEWQQGGKNLSRTVSNSGAEIQKFLKDVWGTKFRGAMVLQSKIWGGMMFNLKESWTDFMRRIADGGFFENVKARLASVLDVLERWNEDGTIDKAATVMSTAFTGVADVLGIVFDRIKSHIRGLNENWDTAKPYVVAFSAALLALMAAWAPLTFAIGAAAWVLDDFVTHLRGGNSFTGELIKKFKDLTADVIPALERTFGDLIRAIKELNWENLGREMAELIVNGIKGANRLWLDAWKSLGDLLKGNDQSWLDLRETISKAVRAAFEGVTNYIRGFWRQMWQRMYDEMPAWLKKAVDYVGGGAGAGGGDGGGGGGGGRHGGVSVRAARHRSAVGGGSRVRISPEQQAELADAIRTEAARIGASPEDVATAFSYETGGTFNPNIKGGNDKYGRKGQYLALMQASPENQKKYGIYPGMPIKDHVAAVGRYLQDRGYEPGMGGDRLYGAINAGGVTDWHMTRSDAGVGGMPGTVADKWRDQMGGHRANARRLLQAGGAKAPATAGGLPGVSPGFDPYAAWAGGPRGVRRDGVPAAPNVTVHAPITQNVKQATDAPAAALRATQGAVAAGVNPSRVQQSPAQ